MSYYMGDYYRGDPGIGSFFKGLVTKAVSFIPGVGPAASAVLGAVMPGGAKTAAAGAITAAAGRVGSAIVKHPVLSAAGAAGALGTMAAAGAGVERMVAGPSGKVRGMHPCKSKHGCKHGAMVPNRRMNPFNPRAARRASRRLHSLVRHYRKYIGFVSARKPKGRPFMKRRKK